MTDPWTVLAEATEWARAEARVRMLVLKGSLGRGEGDARSDLDLVIVTRPGALAELWAERDTIGARLGRWLGGFDEAPWQAPHTFLGFYDGPLKADFFFQEGEPHADPWLRDGFTVLYDPDGLEEDLRAQLAAAPAVPDLEDFDVHAWDWLWWIDVKSSRGGEDWLVHIELVKFVETMLLGGHNALTAEPWRGASRVKDRLGADTQAALEAALPAATDPAELRRARSAALAEYRRLRERLAAERGMPLAAELARQVLASLEASA